MFSYYYMFWFNPHLLKLFLHSFKKTDLILSPETWKESEEIIIQAKNHGFLFIVFYYIISVSFEMEPFDHNY